MESWTRTRGLTPQEIENRCETYKDFQDTVGNKNFWIWKIGEEFPGVTADAENPEHHYYQLRLEELQRNYEEPSTQYWDLSKKVSDICKRLDQRDLEMPEYKALLAKLEELLKDLQKLEKHYDRIKAEKLNLSQRLDLKNHKSVHVKIITSDMVVDDSCYHFNDYQKQVDFPLTPGMLLIIKSTTYYFKTSMIYIFRSLYSDLITTSGNVLPSLPVPLRDSAREMGITSKTLLWRYGIDLTSI